MPRTHAPTEAQLIRQREQRAAEAQDPVAGMRRRYGHHTAETVRVHTSQSAEQMLARLPAPQREVALREGLRMHRALEAGILPVRASSPGSEVREGRPYFFTFEPVCADEGSDSALWCRLAATAYQIALELSPWSCRITGSTPEGELSSGVAAAAEARRRRREYEYASRDRRRARERAEGRRRKNLGAMVGRRLPSPDQ